MLDSDIPATLSLTCLASVCVAYFAASWKSVTPLTYFFNNFFVVYAIVIQFADLIKGTIITVFAKYELCSINTMCAIRFLLLNRGRCGRG